MRNHGLHENISLQSRFAKVATLSLRANVNWNYANSERANYRTRRSWDFQYGPDLSLHLPADLTLSTDFNVYQRAGYDDHSMNDCDLVWNASLGFDFDFRRSSYMEYRTVEYLRTKSVAARVPVPGHFASLAMTYCNSSAMCVGWSMRKVSPKRDTMPFLPT